VFDLPFAVYVLNEISSHLWIQLLAIIFKCYKLVYINVIFVKSYLKIARSILLQVIVSIIGLLLFGKLLEPLWGSKELSKFIFVVNFSTSACVFMTAIVLYYITQQEIYL
jgi:hypothetical protein